MAQNKTMMSVIRSVLREYGLENLTDWAAEMITKGLSETEILQSMRKTEQFKARFPAIQQREAKGLPPISPADYVNYEKAASQLGSYYDLPISLTDRQAIGDLLANDVSAAELEQRVRDGYGRVKNLPPEVKQWFGQIYGADTDRALAAFFIDPDRAAPELMTMAQAAEIGGRAKGFDIGVNRQMAEELARQGVSGDGAQQGFAALDQERGLYNETIADVGNLDVGREGVAAQFGTDPASRRQVENRRDRRMADFAGKGETVTDRGGLIGLGAADQ